MGARLTLDEVKEIQVDILKDVTAVCRENDLQYYLVYGTLLGAVRHSGFIPWDDDIDIALPRDDFDKLESIYRSRPPKQYRWVDYKDDSRIRHNIAKLCDRRTFLTEGWMAAVHEVPLPLGVCIDIFALDGVPRTSIIKELHYRRVKLLKMLMSMSTADTTKPRPLHKKLIIALVKWLMSEPSVRRAVHELLDNAIRQYEFDSSEEVCTYLGAYGKKGIFPKTWIGEGATLVFEGLSLSVFRQYDKYLSQIYGDYLELPPVEQRKSPHQYRAFRVS